MKLAAKVYRMRWAKALTALVLFAVLVFWVARGCVYLPWNRQSPGGRARITVSRDFGREVLRDQEVEAAGISAMEALRKVATVETSYGGGFISSIDGLSSAYRGEGSRKEDWFFYVNGQMAETGAAEYMVREGDRLVFDYHSWELSPFTPCLAGCFPEPFLHGYPGEPGRCAVFYGEGLAGAAEDLAYALREAGAGYVRTESLQAMDDPFEITSWGDYLILLAEVGELGSLKGWRRAMAEAAPRGLFFELDGERLILLDAGGRKAMEMGCEWGLVACLSPRLGEPGSALVVTGKGLGLWEACQAMRKRAMGGDPRPLLAMAYQPEAGEITLPWVEGTP